MKFNDILLVTAPNDGGLAKIENEHVEIIDRISTTGIWIDEHRFVRSIQRDDFCEITIYSKDGTSHGILYEDISDIHDVLLFNNDLYLVSTGTNEVVMISSLGERKRWKVPGDRDAWHLNCLDIWDNKIIVSAFGEFEEDRGYKGKTRNRGFVFELETGKKLWEGLSQPHTPLIHGDFEFICDSETKRLLIKNKAEIREVQFSKYPRGLAINDDYIFVGLSNSRNIKSDGHASVLVLDRESLNQVKEFQLPFNEVYDIRIVNSNIYSQFVLKQTSIVEDLHTVIKNRETYIAEKEAWILELSEWGKSLDKENKEKEYIIQNLKLDSMELNERINLINKNVETQVDKIQSQQSNIAKIADTIKDLSQQLDLKNQTINNLNGHIQELLESDRELNNILSSQGWKALGIYYKTRDLILPKGSRRRLFVKLLFKLLIRPRSIIRKINKQNISKFIFYTRTESSGMLENRIDNFLERHSDVREVPLQIIDSSVPKEKLIFTACLEEPQVSIIIPVYNQWDYTYACLRSILIHTVGIKYEIIIADDVSTDNTINVDQYVENVFVLRDEVNRGFLLNCNNAARHARGKYLFFLNNDTNVQENWLHYLVELMDKDSTIGMSGSKLIYPDGRLQEAGGIIWRDASGWNYGRLDDPNKPEYNYVKEVDYISGAAIMIRTELWNRIGGFDVRYVPAYYEDSDLAFEVRKAGYKVVLEPKSVVVHFEGISHGVSTNNGVKSYQIENQKKFAEKWRYSLESENYVVGQHVFEARERSGRKKTILVIDHYVPHFDKDAGSRTLFQSLLLFVKMGFNVKFIGDNYFKHEPYSSQLERIGIEILYGTYMQTHFNKWLAQNGQYIDYTYLLRPHVSVKYIDMIRKYTNSKVLYNGTDFHYIREVRRYRLEKKPEFLKSARDYKKMEFELFNKSDVVVTISDYEKKLLNRKLPHKKVVVVPTFVYDSEFPIGEKVPFENRMNITFVGSFTHAPNVDGIIWFIEEIFPSINTKIPELKLVVIGSNPPPEIQALKSDSINVTGFVSDEELMVHYQSSRIIVAPLRFGAGVKGKIIEAIAYGVPTVTTPVGSEGIAFAEDVIVTAATVEEFAYQTVELYSNPGKWNSIHQKQLQYAKKFLSMESAQKIFSNEIFE